MSHRVLIGGLLAVLTVAAVSGQATPPAGKPVPQRTAAPSAPSPSAAPQRAVLDKYCVGCHNTRTKAGGLALDQLDLARLPEHADVAEKVALKLRAGMMPPLRSPRPDKATLDGLIAWMENELDRHAVANLTAPGIHRLNRAEYQNVIRDLLGIKIDAAKFLPSDNSTSGFDNIAGALTTSPALMEAYLSAAGKISRLAMASNTAPTFVEFNLPDDATQNYHVKGLPFGTRGGILIEHEFPADGDYEFKIVPIFEGNMGQANDPFGQILGERLAVTIDGKQVHLFDWDKQMVGAPRSGVPTPPIRVTAGLHKVGVTFLATNYAPEESTIVMSSQRDGSRIRLSVSDEGPGVPEADLPRIFERFYRVDKSRTRASRDPGGTGLGLAIVKHLVELHGGKASVSNRAEGGATFIIELPGG